MAPIVFSWPLSSNVPRNFWWHMDTSMYLPSDRRRILSLRSLQHKIYYSTSVLDGVYPSIGRLFAFQLAYLYTTPAISSDYYFFLLLSWTMYSAIYIHCACPTRNDRIIAPEDERGKNSEINFENVSFCLLIAYNLFWYI